MFAPASILADMATIMLDLMGLNCPLPVLKTRKALKGLRPGDLLQVHCTDPLAVLDIPNLIRETGDRVAIAEHGAQGIVFVIERAHSAGRRS
jgi:tRNA 2-thiouridine synthesizing protein A